MDKDKKLLHAVIETTIMKESHIQPVQPEVTRLLPLFSQLLKECAPRGLLQSNALNALLHSITMSKPHDTQLASVDALTTFPTLRTR
jgi:hypothetical protein